MMSPDEMIAILQAHKETRQLQYRRKMPPTDKWEDLHHICFGANFPEHEYRIKPEPPKPREFWLNRYEACNIVYGHTSLSDADAVASISGNRIEVIHVIEILPELQDK